METVDIPSLKIHDGDWILDLGCGEGRHSIACDYHFPKANVIGLDLDFTSLKTASNKHNTYCNKKSTYVKGSGFELPFANESFDHIICSEVLEHIDHYEKFLSEIRRTLKPGGLFCLSVPRFWPERICWALSKAYHQVEGGHVHIFNIKQLSRQIEALKFTTVRRHWAHALHVPYWWLRCLWWRNGKENPLSNIYHKLLVWDLLKRPWLTQTLEKVLNPIMGKSVVYYFKKQN